MGENNSSDYKKDSLKLWGAVSMGTGVMIGAGIFALTGQIAELAGTWFPLAFLIAAIIAGFSAYSYVKMAQAYPSAGGIAMFLKKAYGRSLMTGACALLMYFSMIINESLVARTFGTYTLQLFDAKQADWLVPALGVGLLLFAFRHLREEIGAKAPILITAIVLDVVVLGAFIWVKIQSDMLVIWASLIGLILVFAGEKFFLKMHKADEDDPNYNEPQVAPSRSSEAIGNGWKDLENKRRGKPLNDTREPDYGFLFFVNIMGNYVRKSAPSMPLLENTHIRQTTGY